MLLSQLYLIALLWILLKLTKKHQELLHLATLLLDNLLNVRIKVEESLLDINNIELNILTKL